MLVSQMVVSIRSTSSILKRNRRGPRLRPQASEGEAQHVSVVVVCAKAGAALTFHVPDGVELDKVDASFKKGVLTVTLPKTAEAQKAEKKIARLIRPR